ncbi:telomere-associated protein RIF1 isoform X2 [Triplophysa dalaica]|uniref:telomere-associated protein RIF1 isoform X2 n=1 Tax=Triplophysa dalaica TaxID=1582913 RepID=UPI0024DFA32E|nr:telomere-associated protein RIF1 isoform X2 [Triplophysa dalaica]
MMAAVPLSSASILPLLECLEDDAAGLSEHTDAYITIANRLNGEDGRQFLPVIVKHFARLSKVLLVHISSENEELCQAALQALGFCVFHSHIVSVIPANVSEEVLSTLCNVVVKSKEKFTCTRALWVISKQNFSSEVVAKKTPEILKSLEAMQTREVQSILIDHESLNVIIRLLEQAPSQMAAGAVCWAKLVVPLVVHSANKVRLRAAAAMELGMPLLLEKQQEVAAIVEPMMSSMLIPEMQKLFSSKNETNMLKLWPLFVKLLGKLLHKGGAFINSLLYLEELGFRSSSPNIKKIAFIAWKSLIDNFALNPDILCSSKRLKLLLQPLISIHVRTEALVLTKLEVWWYLAVKLGPNLAANFEQVGIPLLHSTLPSDSPVQSLVTPARNTNPTNGTPNTPKTGIPSCSTPGNTPRMSLNSSMQATQSYRSIQLLGLEMLLHWFMGPEVTVTAAKENLQLSLEPLTHPLFTSHSYFNRHATTLISAVKDGFSAVGQHAPESLLSLVWSNLIHFVSTTIESGNKKERQGSEVLTLLLQALQAILSSDVLPADRALLLLEAAVKGIPQKVLGSAAYQVANMDVLNGTPALFLILLFFNNSQVAAFLEDERFFTTLETLVSCGFCGPTSPLTFGEAVLGALSGIAVTVKSKKQLWRMWSVVINLLTDTITQTNEVNQGDALEHNFSSIYSALMFPVVHLLPGSALPQTTQKSMMSTWSKLYKAFARCSALVATAEENVCCEELCAKISASLDNESLKSPLVLDALANILLVIVESLDFSPYTPQFQQKLKSPRTPLSWVRKRSKSLGNLSTFHSLLIQTLEAFLALDPSEASAEATGGVLNGLGMTLIGIMSMLFSNMTLPTHIQEMLSTITQPLTRLYVQYSSFDEHSTSDVTVGPKLEKLASDLLGCLQIHSTLHDDELLTVLSPLLCVLFPHKIKQIRTVATHFWNATFGNAVTLTYSEPLRVVLSQAKQKTPLILPGFEAVDNPDDFSGQNTSESSQMDPQISGVTVTSVGKRDSFLARAEELKGRSTVSATKPVSIKLDFGSPRPQRREAIEEEASVDFVFIPPETKERVLTEHQKEVKRTKRTDIPALYNNLDASMDTTVFTQYTQSQEDSIDKLTTDEMDKPNEEDKVQLEEVGALEEPTTDVKTTQDGTTPEVRETPEKATQDENQISEKIETPSSDVSVDASGHEKTGLEASSPNVSSSSDMISGTPPKSNSRRQSFITLEKYVEGKPASPMGETTFTGPLTRNSNKLDSSKASQSASHDSLDSQPLTLKEDSQKPEELGTTELSAQNEQEMEEDDEIKSTSHPCEGTDEEDVVPDTQNQITEAVQDNKDSPVSKSNTEALVEPEKASPEEDSQTFSLTSSQERRRSSRRRSRPLRPGEDPTDRGQNSSKSEETGSQGLDSSPTNTQKLVPTPTNSTNSTLLGRSRRSKILEEAKAEGDQPRGKRGKGELKRTDSQISESSQVMDMCGHEELSQMESSKERLSPLNESQSLSPGRSTRKTRLHSNLVGSTDKKEKDEKYSQNATSNLRRRLSQPVSSTDTDSQQTGSLRRTRRSVAYELDAPGSQTRDKTGTEDQKVQDAGEKNSQTLVKGMATRRRHTEGDVNSVTAEDSQAEELDSSQGHGRYRTRRLSKGLLSPTDNTESENSDSKVGPRPKKRPRNPLPAEVLPCTAEAPKMLVAEHIQVSMETSASQDGPYPDPSLDNVSATESKELVNEEMPVTEIVNNELNTSEKEIDTQCKSEIELKVELDTEKKETVCLSIDDKNEGKGTKSSSQDSSVGAEDSYLKFFHKCPHTRGRGRGRGRRRSRSCNCFSKTPAMQDGDMQESQDEKNEQVPLDANVLTSQPDSIPMSLSDENQCTTQDAAAVQSSLSSPDQLPSEILSSESSSNKLDVVVSESSSNKLDVVVSESSSNKLDVVVSESSSNKLDVVVSEGKEEGAKLELVAKPMDESSKEVKEAYEMNQSEGLESTNIHEHKDGADSSENASGSQEALQSSTPQDTSPSKAHPVEDAPVCQEQLESSHVQQEDAVDAAVKESEDLAEKSGEANELIKNVASFENDGVDTQIEKQDLSADVQEAASDADKDASTSDVCLDSPPKPKLLDGVAGELEPGQSPSRSKTCVWSPSASPSTSILKKGQKRACDEDSPSPLLKSRRVSFATPIYHQELADDIDRRSPVIRTSSPRSKVLSAQPKYITTPTKGSSCLSPRNLRSPGYKSSKKCLISEMSQEPRPIAKDCVYPALVGCSTPVEAVLPQITSNMWPRGFGQLVRARNIKTVGDLSALTPTEIKSLPIRSPKLSNVRKALKTYYEQQRKGRSDELKSFDEMEKMTSEPEDMELPQNQDEEKTPAEPKDDKQSDTSVDSGLIAQERNADDLLSDVVALGGQLNSEALGRCSPNQLGLMHEHLSGIMRNIVAQLQSRLLSNLDDSLP